MRLASSCSRRICAENKGLMTQQYDDLTRDKRLSEERWAKVLAVVALVFVWLALAFVACGCAATPVTDAGPGAESICNKPSPWDAKWRRIAPIFARARSIRYAPDTAGQDVWQTPAETEARGAGDCEDKSIWLAHAIIQRGIGEPMIVVGRRRSGAPLHVWVELDGRAPDAVDGVVESAGNRMALAAYR